MVITHSGVLLVRRESCSGNVGELWKRFWGFFGLRLGGGLSSTCGRLSRWLRGSWHDGT